MQLHPVRFGLVLVMGNERVQFFPACVLMPCVCVCMGGVFGLGRAGSMGARDRTASIWDHGFGILGRGDDARERAHVCADDDAERLPLLLSCRFRSFFREPCTAVPAV